MLILAGPAGDMPARLAGLISTSAAIVSRRVDAGLPISLCSEMGAMPASLACRNSIGMGERAGAASTDFRNELRRGGSSTSFAAGLAPYEESAGVDACVAPTRLVTSALFRAEGVVPRDEIESHRRPNLGKLAKREGSWVSLLSAEEKMLLPVPKDDDFELPERPRRCRDPTLEWNAGPCSMSYEYLRELGGYRLDGGISETGGAGSGRCTSAECMCTFGSALSRDDETEPDCAWRPPIGNGVGCGKTVSLSEERDHGNRNTLFRLDVDDEERKREWPRSSDCDSRVSSSRPARLILDKDAIRPRSVRVLATPSQGATAEPGMAAALIDGNGSAASALDGTGGPDLSASDDMIEGNGFRATRFATGFDVWDDIMGADASSGVLRVDEKEGRAEAISVEILTTCSCRPAISCSCLRISSLFLSTWLHSCACRAGSITLLALSDRLRPGEDWPGAVRAGVGNLVSCDDGVAARSAPPLARHPHCHVALVLPARAHCGRWNAEAEGRMAGMPSSSMQTLHA